MLPSPLTSSSSNIDSVTTTEHTFITPPEVQRARESLSSMKGGLVSLKDIFDSLHSQTIHTGILLKDDICPAKEIEDLTQRLCEHQKDHEDGVKEINLILDDLLKNGIVDSLERKVEEEINSAIDSLVSAEFDSYVQKYIPKELQDQLAEQERMLEAERLKLHNTESRRANSLLRQTDPHCYLHALYMDNGKASDRFPRTLQDLFKLDASACSALMEDYGLPLDGKHKDIEANLNQFMRFCGVNYQMIRAGFGTKRVGTQMEGEYVQS